MIDDQHRILPRFTDQAIEHDPLEIALAQRQARIDAAREAIAAQSIELRQPLNPRGWPIAMRGVTGTSPGTDPAAETIRRQHRCAT